MKNLETKRPLFWKAIELTHGTYPGVWNGYEITMTVNGEEIKFTTSNGIRGWAYVSVKITPEAVEYEIVRDPNACNRN